MKALQPFVIIAGICIFICLAALSGKKAGGGPQNAAQLGEMLFNDTLLSADYSISCASCHIPKFGFADTAAFSIGIGKKPTNRNTPSVMNVLSRPLFFWDGRVETLEEQALHPIANPDEMGLPIEEAVKRLNANENYRAYFLTIFGSLPDRETLGQAIAAFEKTLETAATKFERYMNTDSTLFTTEEKLGQELFNDRAKCFDCHFSPDFTGDEFRNIGIFNGQDLNDSGRYKISKKAEDIGRFKVPGLRNIAVTAPYMHNGMFSTLRQVIDYYDNPAAFIPNAINRDTLLQKPLGLTEYEKHCLESFLLTLTDDRFVKE